MGFHDPILDELAERPLDKDELRELLILLFGKKAMLSAPDVHEWREFHGFLCKLNHTEGKHWKATTGKMEHWIDLRKLNRTYSDGSIRGFFGLFSSWRSGSRRSDPSPGKPENTLVSL